MGGRKVGVRYPGILPLIGEQDYSDYLRISSTYRNSLMKFTEGTLTGVFGDANSDGFVGGDDAQLVLNLYVDQMSAKNYYGEGVTYRGFGQIDVNLDGGVAVEDAQYILTYYVENEITGNRSTWAQITGNPQAPNA